MQTTVRAVRPEESWKGIAAAIACVAIVGFALSLSTPLLSLKLAGRGISEFWIGLNTAMAGVGALAIAPFVPWLARRLGTARLLHGALATAGLSLLLFPASAFWVWFPLRFVFSAAITVMFVASEFWINAVAPERRRGFVMGVYATVLAAGFAAGPTVLAAFGSDSMVPFVAVVVAFSLATIPIGLAGRHAPQVDRRASHRLLALLLAAPSATLAAFVFGAVEQSIFGFLPLHAITNGMVEGMAVLLVSAAGIGTMLLQIPLGLLADRTDRTMLLTLCGITGCVGALLLVPALSAPSLAFVVVLLWGGVSAGLYTVGLTLLGERFSGADLVAANALFVMMYSAGMLIGPALAGVVMERAPVLGLPGLFAVVFAAYSLIAGTRWLLGGRAARKTGRS